MTDHTQLLSRAADALKLIPLQKFADDSYCQFVDASRKPECLGWEAKIKAREFGKKELDAHTEAAMHLGFHRAYHTGAGREQQYFALLAELSDALKAAERDAARYAWIRSESEKDCTRWEHQGKWYTSFDDCIDAAIALSANADKGGEG